MNDINSEKLKNFIENSKNRFNDVIYVSQYLRTYVNCEFEITISNDPTYSNLLYKVCIRYGGTYEYTTTGYVLTFIIEEALNDLVKQLEFFEEQYERQLEEFEYYQRRYEEFGY